VTFFKWLSGSEKRQDLARVNLLIKNGFTAYQSREYEKAATAFSEALQFRDILKGSSVLDWLLWALQSAYLLDERFDEAIMFFSGYLSRHPGDTAAYSGRATAFWYAENWIPAVNDYSQILQADRENIEALANRGQVFAEMGSFRAALEDLNKALQLVHSSPTPSGADNQQSDREAFIRRGRAEAVCGLGDTAAALVELERSLQICPENAWAWYTRAQVYEKLGDQQKAASDYEIALQKQEPKLTPARRERARAWLLNR
jgi:tetratricopeptide (TPR) repeat protein